MDPNVSTWLDVVFRWMHVVAGIAWIGHLYFFNFVNAQLAKTYDADSKRKVVPELMPRALYWFRWGAAYTWATGFILMGLVYYMGTGMMVAEGGSVSSGAAAVISLGLILFIFFIYDAVWKALGKNETAGVAVSLALLVAVAFGLSRILVVRAVFIHVGVLFGTIMAMNVWMRIWPAQRKIIAAIRDGAAPDAALVGLAGLRSKHNTYMSVPLVAMMLANHALILVNPSLGWLIAVLLVVVGFLVVKFLYTKSASGAPARY